MIDPLWAATVGSTTPTFDDLYNATVGEWGEHTPSHIYNQYGFTCRAQILSTRAAENGIPSWRYFYNATFPEWDSYVGESEFGAFHGAELALVFGTYGRVGDVENAVSWRDSVAALSVLRTIADCDLSIVTNIDLHRGHLWQFRKEPEFWT